jgi:hypothetical protein
MDQATYYAAYFGHRHHIVWDIIARDTILPVAYLALIITALATDPMPVAAESARRTSPISTGRPRNDSIIESIAGGHRAQMTGRGNVVRAAICESSRHWQRPWPRTVGGPSSSRTARATDRAAS